MSFRTNPGINIGRLALRVGTRSAGLAKRSTSIRGRTIWI